MIEVRVRSNDDNLRRERWPEYVPCKPVEGEVMAAESGRIGKICRITYRSAPSPFSGAAHDKDMLYYLEIEVTPPF
jgi:hypothetical protein